MHTAAPLPAAQPPSRPAHRRRQRGGVSRAVAEAAPAPPPGAVRFSFLWLSRAEYGADGKPSYEDSGLDKLLVTGLAKLLARRLGSDPPRPGPSYDGFVDVCHDLSASLPAPEAQHAFVLSALQAVLPGPVLAVMRAIVHGLRALGLPVGALMAWGTAPFAGWLVGPSNVVPNSSASDDTPAPPPGSGTVLVRRCRFLEASGCKSECVNICKLPTQAFFADQLALPLTMTPDFETFSCSLVFGALPPPVASDPAFRGACLPGCPRFAEGGSRACVLECQLK